MSSQKYNPPHLPHRFFRWYCHPKLVNHIEGDLLEEYGKRVKEKGKWKADLRFWWDVLLLFRQGIIRPVEGYKNLNHYGMWKSNFIIAWRTLLKNKSYTALNAVGLSVGLACFTLIGLWVTDELSYDKFHTKADRIFRVVAKFTSETDNMTQAVTSVPLRKALISDLPEVEDAIILDKNDAIVQRGDKQFMEDFLIMTDPSFFNIFSFQLKSGDKRTALTEPYSIVLSESMAKKYFGNENALGQTLTMFLQDPEGRGKTYTVTGIIEDCPINSHFNYQALVSFSTFDVNNPADPDGYDWYNNSYYTYVLLREGSGVTTMQAKLPQLVEKYMGKNNREWKIGYEYFLQALTEIHLRSDIKYEISPTTNKNYLTIFGAVGVMVLLLAAINYVNMATASSTNRFREVGVRKILGAPGNQLIGQYLLESWILAVFSLVLAIGWIELARPTFESLTARPLANLYTWGSLWKLLVVASMVGLIAGIYPAIVTISFKPLGIIRGQFKTGLQGAFLRKSLVVLQYAIAMLLVIGIFSVQGQLKFVQQHDMGFNQNGLLMLSVNGSEEVVAGYEKFANELKQLKDIEGVARTNTTLAGGLGNSIGSMEDANGKTSNSTVYRVRTDFDYLQVWQMKLLAGRFFEPGNSADSSGGFVVNEAMMKSYGYQTPEQIIGKKFDFTGRNGTIIGVVKNFHYSSLQNQIEPTALYLLKRNFNQMGVRLEGDFIAGLQAVEGLWKRHFPNTVFSARFAEEALNAQYDSEQRYATIFLIFSIVSLAIACLGLLALVSYSINNRTKEISIRKVLGASTTGILNLFTKEFLLLVVLASAIAIPMGYWLINLWLSVFAYRMELNYWIFAESALLVMIIAWITVGVRTIVAALVNPVENLRSE